MKIEIKLKYLLIIVAVLVAGIWLTSRIVQTRHQQEIDAVQTQLWKANKDICNYEITVNQLAEHASEVEMQLVDKDSEIFKLKDVNERLKALNIKNVNAIAELKARISVLQDSIKPEGPNIPSKPPWTVFVPTTGDKEAQALPLPASFTYNDQWVKMWADINKQGVGTLGMDMNPVDLNIVLGQKKDGFLKKKPVAVVTTGSPYVTIAENNVALVDNTTSPWVYVGVGAGATAVLVATLSILIGR